MPSTFIGRLGRFILSSSVKKREKKERRSFRAQRLASSTSLLGLWISLSVFFFFPFFLHIKSLTGNLGHLQEQRYPFLSVCAVFSRVRTMVWPPEFGIFDMHTDAEVCDYTWGLYENSLH